MGAERAIALVDQNPDEFFNYIEILCRKYFATVIAEVEALTSAEQLDLLVVEMRQRGVTTMVVPSLFLTRLTFRPEIEMVPR